MNHCSQARLYMLLPQPQRAGSLYDSSSFPLQSSTRLTSEGVGTLLVNGREKGLGKRESARGTSMLPHVVFPSLIL